MSHDWRKKSFVFKTIWFKTSDSTHKNPTLLKSKQLRKKILIFLGVRSR